MKVLIKLWVETDRKHPNLEYYVKRILEERGIKIEKITTTWTE